MEILLGIINELKGSNLYKIVLKSSPWGSRTPLSRMKILRPNR